MTANRIGPLWDQYLAQVMKQFAKNPPSPGQIEIFKANFYAGVFSAIIALGKDSPMNPAAYREWITTRAEEVRREAEINTADLSAPNGRKR